MATAQLDSARRWLCCITKADHHRWIRETLKNKIVVGLKNKIVVGHDLRGDLKYLGLLQDVSENKHDFELRDTARYEPFQIRKGDTIKYRKLSDLTNDMLKRKIQPAGEFHCCEEDAVAALGMYDMSIF